MNAVQQDLEPTTVRIWRVEVREERSCDIYVAAPDRETAEKDAEELAADALDGEIGDVEVFVSRKPLRPTEYASVVKWETFWSGGSDGEDIQFGNLDEWLEKTGKELAAPRPLRGQLDFEGGVAE